MALAPALLSLVRNWFEMRNGRGFALGLSFLKLGRAEGTGEATRRGGVRAFPESVAQAETLMREFPVYSMPSFL